jgi:uncharacterized protein
MDVTPLVTKGRQTIRSYGNGGFKINESTFPGAVLVGMDSTVSIAASTIGDFTLDVLGPLLMQEPRPEILIVGSGKTMAAIPAEIRTALRAKGIMVESMDTGAACRTFNVLIGEDRRVCAALLAV